jgi:primosomal protein N' (replication factor Y)
VYECEKCNHHDLQQMGTGTQQLESQIENIFPEANILRMDQDTTSGKNAHEELLDKFRSGEANLLIGTQLVAKGLDFPNVTVVGVVNADTELAFPVYDASERMFQLLSQVAGRSGRGEKKGVVFLQTWKPDHHSIQFARKHDYRGFAKKELENREMLFYPPFTKMIRFELKSEDEQAAAHVAEKLVEAMKLINDSWPIMGPSPAAILRIRREFRWEVNLKIAQTNRAKGIEKGLNMILDKFNEMEIKNRNKVRLNIHVDI